MKSGMRIALCASLLLCFSLYLLESHLQDLCNQYRAGSYLAEWLDLKESGPARSTGDGTLGDKVIVMAKLEEEHTEWVEEELPDWQRAIYTVNPSADSGADPERLTTPSNKGHESMAYLTYVIDHYDDLPSIIVFLHSHRSGFLLAWHVDAPLHDNVAAMRMLQLDFVRQNGYVNLRCNWNPGCKESHRYNRHVTDQVWYDIFEGTSTPALNVSEGISPATEYQLEAPAQNYMRKPDQIGAACCAQFAVSSDQVRRRPREDYVKIRQWVLDTELNDASSGRVLEFLWHVIFGMEAVYCPDEEVCYCQVYGRC
ncbi:hypothetical protein N7474_001867 [Penicillium riverlandense]|uniref:uncharacterized protein n=1 Tax=Penicillium riverlandense TaxID=1903569 RepID=UPI00254882B3|nr:uncharacterized protein N7474_001867 [Penicillium riverlandense]KAJ5833556.1 hypothetical protein N7474_001867 [Penicillium riverlandense]